MRYAWAAVALVGLLAASAGFGGGYFVFKLQNTETQLEEGKSDLQKKQQEIENLQEREKRAISEREAVRLSITKLVEQLDRINMSLGENKQENNALKRQISDLQVLLRDVIAGSASQLEEIRLQARTRDAQVANMTKQTLFLQTSVANLTKQTMSLQSRIIDMAQRILDLENALRIQRPPPRVEPPIANAIGNEPQGKIAVGQGRDWIFYCDNGVQVQNKTYSTNTWSNAKTIISSCTDPTSLSIHSNNTHIFLTANQNTFRLYKMHGDGTLQIVQNTSLSLGNSKVSITTNSSGYPVIAYCVCSESWEFIKARDKNGASWENARQIESRVGTQNNLQAVGMDKGSLLFIRSSDTKEYRLRIWYQGNQSFGSEFIISKTSTDAGTSGWRMVNVGSRAHWVYVSEDKLMYRNITSAGQVSNPQTIRVGVRTASLSAANATDSTFRLIFSYITTSTAKNPNQIRIAETDSRTTIVRDQTLQTGQIQGSFLNAIRYYNSSNPRVTLLWVNSSGPSPNLSFTTFNPPPDGGTDIATNTLHDESDMGMVVTPKRDLWLSLGFPPKKSVPE